MSIQNKVKYFFNTIKGLFVNIHLLGHVHPNDDMLNNKSHKEHIDAYLNAGFSAIQNIEESLELVDKNFGDVRNCLVLPCGYGRELRFLQMKMPSNKISACDINEEAVRFCNLEFGAKPIISNIDFTKIKFTSKYDLIWVGSLFTHLDTKLFAELYKVLYNVLAVNGVLIFTTHGEYDIDVFAKYGFPIPENEIQKLKNEGHYFILNHDSTYYGSSIYLKGYVLSETNRLFNDKLKLIQYKCRGWDHHQDVYSFQKIK